MYPNFGLSERAGEAQSRVRARIFGKFAVKGADCPLLHRVPFPLADGAVLVEIHLARPNPILRDLTDGAVLGTTGADDCIAPD